jgi:hypothetical protein
MEPTVNFRSSHEATSLRSQAAQVRPRSRLENIGGTFLKQGPPRLDPVRMDIKMHRKLGQRHLFLFLAASVRQNSTYRPVQITETGSPHCLG